jgi:UDP-glucose 4-epimerase
MKILITGIAGWIGSNVAQALLSLGHEVVGIDNLSTGQREAVPQGVSLYVEDIMCIDQVYNIFEEEEPEVVYHFAGVLSVPEAEQFPAKYYHINENGTKLIVQACKFFAVKQLIFSSTAAVYSPSLNPVHEDSQTVPKGVYGRTKFWAEKAIVTGEVPYTIFRYFNVAGHGQKNNSKNLIKMACLAALGGPELEVYGDGSAVRDFIHINDLVEAHVLALGNPKAYDEVFNLGYNTPVSVMKVIDTLSEELERPVPFQYKDARPGDIPVSIANSSKAQKRLNWAPKFGDLSGILMDSYEWFNGPGWPLT